MSSESNKIINAEDKALLLDLIKVAGPMGVKVATGTVSPASVKTALTELARIYPAAHKQAVARLRQHNGGTGKKNKRKTARKTKTKTKTKRTRRSQKKKRCANSKTKGRKR